MDKFKKTAEGLFSPILKTAAGFVLSFALSLMLSVTPIFGGMFPLGVAFCAAVPQCFLISSISGAFLGYFIPAFFGSGLKYISILFGTVALKTIIIRLKKESDTAYLTSALSAGISFFIGFISIWDFTVINFLTQIAESMISSAFAYFLYKAFRVNFSSNKGLDANELASVIISVNILLLGVYNINIGALSLGRILAVILILLTAFLRSSSGGATMSLSVAVSLYFSGCPEEIALFLAVGGLLAGFFSSNGRVMSAIAMLFCSVFCAIVTGFSENSVGYIAETFLGGVVFLILPSRFTSMLTSVLAKKTYINSKDVMKKTLVAKLNNAGDALEGINKMVDMVSENLEKYTKKDYDTVLKKVEADACKGCLLRANCWGQNKETTLLAVLSFTTALKRNKRASVSEIPADFSDRCLRLERFENAVTVYYNEFLTAKARDNRIREMREILCEQTYASAGILRDMGRQFEGELIFDYESAANVSAALKTIGVFSLSCSCIIDSSNKMSVELKAENITEAPINRRKILNVVENVLGKKFNPPMVKREDGEVYITLCEKSAYTVDFAISQKNSGNNLLSGDACEGFFDGKGKFFMLLSDGMGTGSRAAVDSAMVIGLMGKLARAGFSYTTALALTNSALRYKSGDESTATVDISVIDLFNGATQLLKAGAAPSVIRRSGKAGKAQCKTLPAGILKDVSFDRAILTLKANDIVVMMSDGVTADGTEWICKLLENDDGSNAKHLAEKIVFEACKNQKVHPDDVTVMVAILEKEV